MPLRPLVLLALALALAAAPLAAKPGAPRDPEQSRYRGDAVAVCVRQIGETEGADPGDVEALCACAADRFVAGREASASPALDPSGMPAPLGAQVLSCLTEVRPANASALAAAAMRATRPVVTPPAATAATPDKPAADDEPAAPSGPGLIDRLGNAFDRLSLSGLPRWAWILVGLIGLLVLHRVFRRPERDDDLMGPPRPDHYRNLPRY